MGRAIDTEKNIQTLRTRVNKLEDTLRGMVCRLDEISEKSVKVKHVDLIKDVDKMEKKDEKEKTDNEGNNKSGKQSNNKSRKSSKKSV